MPKNNIDRAIDKSSIINQSNFESLRYEGFGPEKVAVIVETLTDNKNRTAFTIWCFDIESSMEWYSPARYFSDFKDLRNALIRIDKAIGDIPFPSFSWSLGFPGISSEANESESTKQARRQQLENFLRNLFSDEIKK